MAQEVERLNCSRQSREEMKRSIKQITPLSDKIRVMSLEMAGLRLMDSLVLSKLAIHLLKTSCWLINGDEIIILHIHRPLRFECE